jgi:phosphoribosylformylglycinamidine synthase
MLILAGDNPFSAFRRAALLKAVQAAPGGAAVRDLRATQVFFLDAPDDLPAAARRRAAALLGTEEPFRRTGGVFVTPRKGTVSPWSSKATDIFRNCGLDGIQRVEHGLHLRLLDADGAEIDASGLRGALPALHDRMTEGVYQDLSDLFTHPQPPPHAEVDIRRGGLEALRRANVDMGLALSEEEIAFLYGGYVAAGRNPTDAELVMFGQVNSEHCRHKIFNAEWVVEGETRAESLFAMIRNTHARNPGGVLVAYRDNAAVIEGFEGARFEVRGDGSRVYHFERGALDLIAKVETHNHPTAISPFPGAATGVGGEIRDESATGVGGRSKAGLSAFMVSHLRVPGFPMPWELDHGAFPSRLATPLQIMLEGPIGGASFGNEYGRPALLGLFRTLEDQAHGRNRGYHKPIMVAGGMGHIKRAHVHKRDIPPGAAIVQLGGPAMRIGLGGGAASSMATGSNLEELDYNSVQRGNAEMERRCQEVIDACAALGADNPILSIHDLGAGGLSNGCPELVSETGGRFDLRAVPNLDLSMSPMEIWCCEAQERYVLAVARTDVPRFLALCERERCPAAVIGAATGGGRLVLEDSRFRSRPIDMDMEVLLGKPPRLRRDVRRAAPARLPLALGGITVAEAAARVLRMPSVAAKTFLITIADRSVTGLVARDQMVGPWQTPVADAAVTAADYLGFAGEAMAMGERTPLALLSAPASGRMAVAEALTNIACARVGDIGNVKLSANWMCACGEEGEDAALYDTVRAVGMDFCPALGVAIPVGKDSLSMRTVWSAAGREMRQTAPLSLIVSAFAPVTDVRRTVTPDLKPGDSELWAVDLGRGRNRLGGSALAQAYNAWGGEPPDVEDPAALRALFAAVQELVAAGVLLAYHDRSDGGWFAALAEMAVAGRRGIAVDLPAGGQGDLGALFSEEIGVIFQCAPAWSGRVADVLRRHGLADAAARIGVPTDDGRFALRVAGRPVFEAPVLELWRGWTELTGRMQALRDNPACVREEYDAAAAAGDPGMNSLVTFDPRRPFSIGDGARPRTAILREQGVNGHVEMAAAFHLAGFESVDVHMTDLFSGRETLARFHGLVACGGFSYGDVLGAGSGWAKSILFNERLTDMFRAFFARPETFALGVCNGCQMMSQLAGIIPGAEGWPRFVRNLSEQFEARYATVEVLPSPSVLLRGMEGSLLPIPVAHGEGRVESVPGRDPAVAALRYVDNRGAATERYPLNPNGSAGGLTGFTTPDGRATILMPHPERNFRAVQMSHHPRGWPHIEEGPWLELFRNARRFVG